MKYCCPKCNHKQCETGEMFTAGSFWMKIFNIQNKKYSVVTCKRCSYTELYNTELKNLANAFDFRVT